MKKISKNNLFFSLGFKKIPKRKKIGHPDNIKRINNLSFNFMLASKYSSSKLLKITLEDILKMEE